jgi:hypothetical protein
LECFLQIISRHSRIFYIENFAKIAPINNIYWSAFSINRIKMLNINLKSEKVSKIKKIISDSLLGVDLFKQAKTGPKYLVRLSL